MYKDGVGGTGSDGFQGRMIGEVWHSSQQHPRGLGGRGSRGGRE